MHRAVARHPRIPQPSTRRLVHLHLPSLPGERLEDDHLLLLLSVLYLIRLRSALERNRNREVPASEPVQEPEPEPEEITGVHLVLKEPEPPPKLKPAKPRKRKPQAWAVSEEIAGQYARCVLGLKGSFKDFLDTRAEKTMDERRRKRQQFIPVAEVRKQEWLTLSEHVRSVVMSMSLTLRSTPDGFQIRRLERSRHQAALEAVVCPNQKRIIRIYSARS